MRVSYGLISKKEKKQLTQVANPVSKITQYFYIFCFIYCSKKFITHDLVGHLKSLFKIHRTADMYVVNFKSSQEGAGICSRVGQMSAYRI